MHQTIDDKGTFSLRSTENRRVPENMALIDETISAAGLVYTGKLELISGIERIVDDLEYLTITGGMQLTGNTPISIGQFQLIH
jgi:hypothetical protein